MNLRGGSTETQEAEKALIAVGEASIYNASDIVKQKAAEKEAETAALEALVARDKALQHCFAELMSRMPDADSILTTLRSSRIST